MLLETVCFCDSDLYLSVFRSIVVSYISVCRSPACLYIYKYIHICSLNPTLYCFLSSFSSSSFLFLAKALPLQAAFRPLRAVHAHSLAAQCPEEQTARPYMSFIFIWPDRVNIVISVKANVSVCDLNSEDVCMPVCRNEFPSASSSLENWLYVTGNQE